MRVVSRTCSPMRNGAPCKPQGCPYCSGKRHFPVRCVETDVVYYNITDALVFAHIKTPSQIYKCCAGKIKTAGGYHWKYVDEEE